MHTLAKSKDGALQVVYVNTNSSNTVVFEGLTLRTSINIVNMLNGGDNNVFDEDDFKYFKQYLALK